MTKCYYGRKCLFGKELTAECEFEDKKVDKYIFYLLGSSCCQCGKALYAYHNKNWEDSYGTYSISDLLFMSDIVKKYNKIKDNKKEYEKYIFLYNLNN